jgi:3D (Asp-Asp-Asp) domain-containing protein
MVVHRYRTYHESFTGYTTYYSPGQCDSTGGGMETADGSEVYWGEVANSVLAFGTKIHITPAIKGKRDFVVHDRFGSEQPLGRFDIWVPCGDSIPNPTVRVTVYTVRTVVFYRRVPIH